MKPLLALAALLLAACAQQPEPLATPAHYLVVEVNRPAELAREWTWLPYASGFDCAQALEIVDMAFADSEVGWESACVYGNPIQPWMARRMDRPESEADLQSVKEFHR